MSTHLEHVAWTGGSSPRLYSEVMDTPEGAYTKQLFVADLSIWRDYWNEKDVPRDARRAFWVRARYDAHATYRATEKDGS